MMFVSERVFTNHVRQVNRVVFNPGDRDQLLSASMDGFVKIWTVRTGDVFFQIGKYVGAAFSCSNSLLAFLWFSFSIKLYVCDFMYISCM